MPAGKVNCAGVSGVRAKRRLLKATGTGLGEADRGSEAGVVVAAGSGRACAVATGGTVMTGGALGATVDRAASGVVVAAAGAASKPLQAASKSASRRTRALLPTKGLTRCCLARVPLLLLRPTFAARSHYDNKRSQH